MWRDTRPMEQARLRGAYDGRGRAAAATVLIAVALGVVVGALVIIAATGGAAG
jgi:hypothetical protein